MSLSGAAIYPNEVALSIGIGCIFYSCWKYSDYINSGDAQHRKMALVCMAMGVSALAIAMLNANYSQQAMLPSAQSIGAQVASCPIHELKDILRKKGNITQMVFDIFNQTQGISCANYLLWKNEFEIDGTTYIKGICPSHLQKAAMWGIKRENCTTIYGAFQRNRVFIALKYLCNRVSHGAVALLGDPWEEGTSGIFEAKNCSPNLGVILNPHRNNRFFENLTTLLQSGSVHAKSWYGASTISLTNNTLSSPS